MSAATRGWRTVGWTVGVTFAVVLGADLGLVACAGTDVPFHDQWNIEGAWLFPRWLDGSLQLRDLAHPFNEHRILWTHLLNLGLFEANGARWDPLVELTAIAGLRAACAASLAGWVCVAGRFGRGASVAAGAVIGLAFLPQLAWHVCLWGIESHAALALWFSWAALALLAPAERGPGRTIVGLALALAAMLAMAVGALVPVALLGLAWLRAWERRAIVPAWRELWPVALLGALALFLRQPSIGPAVSRDDFLRAAVATLSWPHPGRIAVALLLNAPVLAVAVGRLRRARTAAPAEDVVLSLAGWGAALCLATAWSRGATVELATGVPSRYADFLVVLPLANVWCAAVLVREGALRWRRPALLVAVAWAGFLGIGWVGLSTEMLHRVIIPRCRDREAPVRLLREFQRTGDPAVFAGQPRLLVPHPNLRAVKAVLDDPRMRGHLPPSLQPDQPLGPLSRGVRCLLGRH